MGCGCCNNIFGFGLPSFNFGSNLFSMPTWGNFSYTIWGMINSDYRFYEPTPSLDMYCYAPFGGAFFSSPGGFNYGGDVFSSMMCNAIAQTNWQFSNSMNGGGNMGGIGYTNPYAPGMNGFNGVNGNNGNNGNNGGDDSTKEEKDDYNTLRTFLTNYATDLNRDGAGRGNAITEKLNEINALQIEETKEDGTTTKRSAKIKEKLAKLKEYCNELINSEKSTIQEYIVSGRFKEMSGCSSESLAAMGYEMDTGMDTRTSDAKTILKDKNVTEDKIKNANIPSTVTKNNVLEMISAYNTNCGSRLVEDMVWALKNYTDANSKKQVEKHLNSLKQSLIDRANSAKGYLKDDATSKTEFEKLITDLQSSNITDVNFADRFNSLYVVTRMVEARNLVNDLEYKYGSILPGLFKFIVDNTEADLKNEKFSSGMISKANNMALAKSNTRVTNAPAGDDAPADNGTPIDNGTPADNGTPVRNTPTKTITPDTRTITGANKINADATGIPDISDSQKTYLNNAANIVAEAANSGIMDYTKTTNDDGDTVYITNDKNIKIVKLESGSVLVYVDCDNDNSSYDVVYSFAGGSCAIGLVDGIGKKVFDNYTSTAFYNDLAKMVNNITKENVITTPAAQSNQRPASKGVTAPENVVEYYKKYENQLVWDETWHNTLMACVEKSCEKICATIDEMYAKLNNGKFNKDKLEQACKNVKYMYRGLLTHLRGETDILENLSRGNGKVEKFTNVSVNRYNMDGSQETKEYNLNVLVFRNKDSSVTYGDWAYGKMEKETGNAGISIGVGHIEKGNTNWRIDIWAEKLLNEIIAEYNKL